MNSVIVKDPRININNPEDVEVVITTGAQRITQLVHTADSNSNTQTNFSFQPPSTKTIVDRHILLKIRLKIVALGGGYFDLGTSSALRQLPLSSIMDNVNIIINGGSISDTLSRRIHAMLRFNNDAESRNKYLNKSPSMPDQYLNYDDWLVYGSNRNPLAAYGEVGNEQSRGGFPFVSGVELVPGSNQYSELVFDVTEPLFMSPLMTGLESHSDAGFVNVNQIDINIKWTSDIQRVLSHANLDGNTLSGLIVTFDKQPQIIVNYLTPDNNYPLPMLQVLPYFKFNDYIKDIGSIPANTNFTGLSDTIKLNQIPKHLFLFAKRSRSTETFLTSDVFARINNVSILWNNETAVFSTYTKEGLFDISKRNECNLLYSQWDKYTGSVFKLEFGIDLGLPEGLSSGTMGQYTISAQVDFTNLNDTAVTYEFFISTLMQGSAEISENSLSLNLGGITVNDVVDASINAPEVASSDPVLGVGKGGSFFSNAKHFINRVSRGVGDVSKFAQKYVAPAVSMINPAIGQAISSGANIVGNLADKGRMATGGGYGKKGSGYSGGRLKYLTRR